MSYTPPSGSAVPLHFSSGYVAPSGSAVQFAFTPLDAHPANGFCSTSLGTPSHAQGVPASGFQSVWFGTPAAAMSYSGTGFSQTTFGVGTVVFGSFGFLTANVGTPRTPLLVTGFAGTAFGAASGQSSFYAASIGHVTQWAPWTGYTPVNQTTQAAGFSSTWVSRPGGFSAFPPVQSGQAYGFKSAQFGAPKSTATQNANASGTVVTQFGAPTGNVRQLSTTLGSVFNAGTPSVQGIQQAVGVRSTQFGNPSLRRTFAQHGASSTKLGTPHYFNPNARVSWGLGKVAKFGRPVYRQLRTVTAIQTTQFGTHTRFDTHHAPTLWSSTQFGNPLLTRVPLC